MIATVPQAGVNINELALPGVGAVVVVVIILGTRADLLALLDPV